MKNEKKPKDSMVIDLAEAKHKVSDFINLVRGKTVVCHYSDPEQANLLDFFIENFVLMRMQKMVIMYNNHTEGLPFYLPNFHEKTLWSFDYKIIIEKSQEHDVEPTYSGE